MNINNLCMGCMQELLDGIEVCPHCGYKAGTVNSSRGLQPQTILNGKYLVGKVIGEGGFGITYIAYDLVLKNRVAIKEYFPSDLATRDTSLGSQTALTVLTGSKEEQYKKGIERFIREAENLAKFNNLDGIVSVKEFFYENNTAYMVMEYIDGVTLSKYLEDNGGKLPYTTVLEMIKPVMESLEKVHSAGIIHRDISPDNIMLTTDGKLKLIDFGAARLVDNNDVKSLTVILKHGYAPEEQYHPDGKQGPWTDVYALSATMYRMITGIVPQESTDRILNGDKVEKVKKLVPEISLKVSDAIMHGLEVSNSSRTKSISEFIGEIEGTSKKQLWKKVIRIGVPVVAIIAAIIIVIAIKPFTPKEDNETVIESAEENTDAETKENESISENVKEPEESKEVEECTENNDGEELLTENNVSEENEKPALVEKTEEELIELIESESGYPVIKEKMNELNLLSDKELSQINKEFSYRIYDDFNGDGCRELFAYVVLEEKIFDHFSLSPYWIDNTNLWYSDGMNTFQVERSLHDLFGDDDNNSELILFGLTRLQFGRTQDVSEIYISESSIDQDPQAICQTYSLTDGNVQPIISMNTETGYVFGGEITCISSDEDFNPIAYDLTNGKHISMVFQYFDENFNSEYGSKNYKDWGFYIYPYYYIYKNESEYYIYDITEIDKSSLSEYNNYPNVINEVENALYNTNLSNYAFDLWGNKPYSADIDKIYVSDNEKIYINYLLHTNPYIPEWEDEETWGPAGDPQYYNLEYKISVVFSVIDNNLLLDGILPGWMDKDTTICDGAISFASQTD